MPVVTKQTLRIAGSVPADDQMSTTYTPDSGETVWIDLFHGEASYSRPSTILLYWDFQGGSEEKIWLIHGGGKMPFKYKVIGNGTKKLAICALNQDAANAVYMSAYTEFRIIK